MNTALTQKEPTPAAQPVRENETYVAPVVDIRESKDAYTIYAEMPGVTKAGLEITVEDNELVIAGRRQDCPCAGEALHRETRPMHYRRTFELSPEIETSNISARMDQGLLVLTLRKAAKAAPRRIQVEG
jgi:HSP20 family molecular chaperone IbpA